jgi:hypothetical protein
VLSQHRRGAYSELGELGELCNGLGRARVVVRWSTNGPAAASRGQRNCGKGTRRKNLRRKPPCLEAPKLKTGHRRLEGRGEAQVHAAPSGQAEGQGQRLITWPRSCFVTGLPEPNLLNGSRVRRDEIRSLRDRRARSATREGTDNEGVSAVDSRREGSARGFRRSGSNTFLFLDPY